jgi:RimJ/RimL family protein N-acetyltransferase
MIFKTDRLVVRKLKISDFEAFYKLQSNPKVMRFVRVNISTNKETEEELKELIKKYILIDNNFWIYAIMRKSDQKFVGTCALIKDDNNDDEIGYRFLEEFWGLGYGLEVCKGLVSYCKSIFKKKLVAYVADENIASAKIVKKSGFIEVSKGMEPNLKVPETKFQIILY